MVPGGTRFTRTRRRAPPAVIDVDVRPKHDTLYDVLVVSPDASTREIRKVARALRRNLPEDADLHDVCLAEQVLGRGDLRAEYDDLLVKLRIAGQPVPRIGAAIEGSHLGPSFGARVGSAGRAGASAAGKAAGAVLSWSFIILIVIGIIIGLSSGGSSSSRYDSDRYRIPDFKPVQLPKLDPKLFEYKPMVIPKLEIPRVDLPKLDPIPMVEVPEGANELKTGIPTLAPAERPKRAPALRKRPPPPKPPLDPSATPPADQGPPPAGQP